jgi:hypothetical protein
MGPILPAVDRNVNKRKAQQTASQLMLGFSEKLEEKIGKNQANVERNKENEALKMQGIDLAGINDPKMRQLVTSEMLKGERAKEKMQEEQKSLSQLFGNRGGKKETSDFNQENSGLNEGGIDPEQLSDEDIAYAETIRHGLGSTLQQMKSAKIKEKSSNVKEESRKFEADRAYHTKTSQPYLDEANEVLKNEKTQKGLTDQLKMDIKSGNTTGLWPFMVDKLGLESFRNPESARFTNEVKNKFVSSLQDIPGARPNMFIERFLSTAQPMLGRTPEANLSVLELDDFIDDMNVERAKKIREIAEEDRNKHGYVRNDVVERAEKKMGDFANKRQSQMAYDIRKIHEDYLEKDQDLLKEIILGEIPEGSPVTKRTMRLLMIKNDNNPEKAVAEAKKLKMVFPSEEVYNRHEQ